MKSKIETLEALRATLIVEISAEINKQYTSNGSVKSRENTFIADGLRTALGIVRAALAQPAEAERAVAVTSSDLRYLLACVDAHADEFPVPSHMRELVARVRAALSPSSIDLGGKVERLTRELRKVASFVETHWEGAGLPLEAAWIIARINKWSDEREAAESRLATAEDRIKKLEADLKFADEQCAKLEALFEPHVDWTSV